MTKAGLWLNAALATLGIVAFLSIAGFCGYKWLAYDEPNRSFGAGGSRGGTSFAGETTNMILTFVFGGIALFGIWLTATTVRSHLRPKQEHRPLPTVSRQVVVVHGDSQLSAVMRLQQLEGLRAAGAISEDEYQRQRGQVISEI
jgi:hypothetical protein